MTIEQCIATLDYCGMHGRLCGRDCMLHCDDEGNLTKDCPRDHCPGKDLENGCIRMAVNSAKDYLAAMYADMKESAPCVLCKYEFKECDSEGDNEQLMLWQSCVTDKKNQWEWWLNGRY